MRWLKDPDDTVQYMFDWAPLTNGNGDIDLLDMTSSPVESIDTATVSADTGLTVVGYGKVRSNTAVMVKLSGGTAGKQYSVTCDIVTTAGQELQRTATLHVTNR